MAPSTNHPRVNGSLDAHAHAESASKKPTTMTKTTTKTKKPTTKAKPASSSSASSSTITDPRFRSFVTDPRYRLPSKRQARTRLDERFSALLRDDDGGDGEGGGGGENGRTPAAKVDRYGRRVGRGKEAHVLRRKEALRRLYFDGDGDQQQQEEEEEGGGAKRGGKNAEEGDAGDEEDGGQGREAHAAGGVASHSDDDDEIDPDTQIRREMQHVNDRYDPARGGGYSTSSSEDEEDDEDDDEEDEDHEAVELEADFPDMQAAQGDVESGEITDRIAVVNMDWDNVRAVDLLAVFTSFVPPGGRIKRIAVYQSEFGKERMQREELEGPPREIFASNAKNDDDDDDDAVDSADDDDDSSEVEEKIKQDLLKEDSGEEFDSAALRRYQLERLRYYYAVLECGDTHTAQTIYEATDGTEYLSSANFFDLRFVPFDTDFDDRPRDECNAVPPGYKPAEFVTTALQHSKVKLTWDMTPEESTRKDAIKRAFTGSRDDINENNLRAYLGSDSEEEEEEEEEEAEEEGAVVEDAKTDAAKPELSKKELARRQMRAALGLTEEPRPSSKTKDRAVGDMQITFTAGLSTNTDTGVFENEPIVEETTMEKYVRKERERKARRREKAKAARQGREPGDPAQSSSATVVEKEDADLGFEDPFFANEAKPTESTSTNKIRKEERLRKREAKEKADLATTKEKAKLEAVMHNSDGGESRRHFDMNEIQRAEKDKAQTGKKSKRKRARPGHGKDHVDGDNAQPADIQEGFRMDVEDQRFGKVFENHEFAIDPSHPRFRGTRAMNLLLAEGRKKRGAAEGQEEGGDHGQGKKRRKRVR